MTEQLLIPPDKPFAEWTIEEAQAYEDSLTATFTAHKTAYQEASLLKDEAEETFRQTEKQLWDYLEQRGMRSLVREDGTFSRRSQVYPNVPQEGLVEFINWCNANNVQGQYLTMAVRKTPFNELVKGLLERGEALPPGVPTPEPRKYINLTRR